MVVIDIMLLIATAYAVLWACYVLGVPVAAGLRRLRAVRLRKTVRETDPNIAVIVPAYNMTEFVTRCVGSLFACDYPKDKLRVYVVADHCTDDTADLARDAGASVLVREAGPRGKTYTLAWTFDQLSERESIPDLYVVVDATARVDPAFLRAMARRWMAGEDIVIGRAVLDLQNQQWFARCLGLTLAHRNLQNWAREDLGLSAFVSGRGMAYSRDYIRRYGWSLALPTTTNLGAHPTEDWRHGVRIVEEGLRAAFADDARVVTPLRDSLSAATKQGVRWERGRMANASTHGIRLLAKGVHQCNKLKMIAALDSIQPPVAILAGLSVLIAILVITIPASMISVSVGLMPLALLGVYGFTVLAQGSRDGISPKVILWAPVYVAWRCMAFVLAIGLIERSKAAADKHSK